MAQRVVISNLPQHPCIGPGRRNDGDHSNQRKHRQAVQRVSRNDQLPELPRRRGDKKRVTLTFDHKRVPQTLLLQQKSSQTNAGLVPCPRDRTTRTARSNLNRELWFATLPILIFAAVRGQPCIWGHLGQVVNSCSTDPKDRQRIFWNECPSKRSEEAELYWPPA